MAKKILALTLLLAGIVFFSLQSKDEGQDEKVGETTKEAPLKVISPPKELSPSTAPTANIQEKKILPSEASEEKKISLETERDFLKLKLPATLPSSSKERYEIVYKTYLISSFYLNEVAAGNLSTDKDRLTKAFRGMALYFKEMDSTYQPDSALALIEANHSALFHDALEELPSEEKTLIEEALKLQSEEE